MCFSKGVTTNPDGGPIIFISCHRVEELQTISVNDKTMEFGAAVTFTKMEDFVRKLKIEGGLYKLTNERCIKRIRWIYNGSLYFEDFKMKKK